MPLCSRHAVGCFAVLAWFAGSIGDVALADDADKIDGALWQFGMSPVKPGPPAMRGIFRVKGKELFQKTTPDSKELDKVVGTKTGFRMKAKTTLLDIEDLRAREKMGGRMHTGIKGKLSLTFDELGEWSGRFVDSDGRHWDFRCKRFQE